MSRERPSDVPGGRPTPSAALKKASRRLRRWSVRSTIAVGQIVWTIRGRLRHAQLSYFASAVQAVTGGSRPGDRFHCGNDRDLAERSA